MHGIAEPGLRKAETAYLVLISALDPELLVSIPDDRTLRSHCPRISIPFTRPVMFARLAQNFHKTTLWLNTALQVRGSVSDPFSACQYRWSW